MKINNEDLLLNQKIQMAMAIYIKLKPRNKRRDLIKLL